MRNAMSSTLPPSVISHVSLGANDYPRQGVLRRSVATLQIRCVMGLPGAAGCGRAFPGKFWVQTPMTAAAPAWQRRACGVSGQFGGRGVRLPRAGAGPGRHRTTARPARSRTTAPTTTPPSCATGRPAKIEPCCSSPAADAPALIIGPHFLQERVPAGLLILGLVVFWACIRCASWPMAGARSSSRSAARRLEGAVLGAVAGGLCAAGVGLLPGAPAAGGAVGAAAGHAPRRVAAHAGGVCAAGRHPRAAQRHQGRSCTTDGAGRQRCGRSATCWPTATPADVLLFGGFLVWAALSFGPPAAADRAAGTTYPAGAAGHRHHRCGGPAGLGRLRLSGPTAC